MDWKQHITQLQAKGYTQQQIALECGCSQAGICDLVRGRTKEPRYAVGAKLLDLLAKPSGGRKPKPTQTPARRAVAATENVAQGVANV